MRIGTTLSEPHLTTHGVPQGSILGPVLFNIYINDLLLVPNICSLESYVDDSKLYISFPVKDIDIVAGQLTEDLRRIAAWCCANSLLINPDKTKLLLNDEYEINHMWTADMKWNEEWSSQLWSQFLQLRKEAWKNSGLQRGLNPWPRDTGATLYQLSYEATDVGSRSILDHSSFSFHFISASEFFQGFFTQL